MRLPGGIYDRFALAGEMADNTALRRARLGLEFRVYAVLTA